MSRAPGSVAENACSVRPLLEADGTRATIMKAEVALSKFAFSDLAIRSAVELEKARAGTDFETAPLEQLAAALTRTSHPDDAGAPFKFVEPGYYEPYERLYRQKQPERAKGVEEIQAFVGDAVERLRAFKPGSAQKESAVELVKFCIALHRELIRELASEDVVVRHEWRRPDFPAPASLR